MPPKLSNAILELEMQHYNLILLIVDILMNRHLIDLTSDSVANYALIYHEYSYYHFAK